MATTTNYSWTTPDDTALVKDGAAAIRTLGSSIDTTTKALNPSTTLGDIEYRSSTANTNTRLAIGTTGQVLSVVGGVPAWAASSSKVVQIVSAIVSTQALNSTTTFADTGLTATITPTSASNKILIFVNQNGIQKTNGNVDNAVQLKLLRGATNILTIADTANYTETALNLVGTTLSASYIDSPATTSATTYKTQFANIVNATGAYVQRGGFATSTIVLMEVTP